MSVHSTQLSYTCIHLHTQIQIRIQTYANVCALNTRSNTCHIYLHCILCFTLKMEKESCDKTLNIAKSTFVHQCKRQSNFGDEYLRALHSRAEDSIETAPSWEVVMWRQALQQLPHWTPSHLPPGSYYPPPSFHPCLRSSCCFEPRYRCQAFLPYLTQPPTQSVSQSVSQFLRCYFFVAGGHKYVQCTMRE